MHYSVSVVFKKYSCLLQVARDRFVVRVVREVSWVRERPKMDQDGREVRTRDSREWNENHVMMKYLWRRNWGEGNVNPYSTWIKICGQMSEEECRTLQKHVILTGEDSIPTCQFFLNLST